MSLYMPGAVQRPQPGGVTLDTSLPPRFIWHITWDKLQADGSQPDFSAVADYLIRMEYCPHIMWNPFTGHMEQYYPANVGGRALAYNNQDGSAAVQVEVFFTPGCVVDGVKYNTVADTPLVGWEDLLAWGDSLGIPRTWPMGSPQWSGNNRDAGTWNNNAGHYGHCHSPGDTHTDPGPMPALAGTITTQSATITPAEEDMPLSGADHQFILEAIDDYFKNVRPFEGNRNIIDAINQTRVDVLSTKDVAAGIPQKVLYEERVDGRNLFDWFRQARADVVGVPVAVLNQQFTLPDGTVTNLAGILSAIHAQPAGATVAVPADPQDVVRALATQLAK